MPLHMYRVLFPSEAAGTETLEGGHACVCLESGLAPLPGGAGIAFVGGGEKKRGPADSPWYPSSRALSTLTSAASPPPQRSASHEPAARIKGQ